MNPRPRITLLGSQDRDLREWLGSHPEGHERGAMVLFRRLARTVAGQPQSDRFLAIDIIRLDGEWILASSPTHLYINLRKLPDLLFRCEKENLELGFVHNHPTGYSKFSPKDDDNEKNILHGLSGCNGEKAFLVALVLNNGSWIGRVRQGTNPEIGLSVRHISVLTDKIDIHGVDSPCGPNEVLKRQEAAFGSPFNAKLQSLRVAVVGAGGTGSPMATLLARAGVGELMIIDGDTLEATNLNRVRGYRLADVGNNKAVTLKNFIDSFGLGTTVSAIDRFLDSPEALDALSSADVIFGCTDDQAGRSLMNEAMYYHAQVYIDCGLSGKVDTDEDGSPYLRDHRGRVSCILPEAGACLRCQRVVTEDKLRYEEAIRENPELAKIDPITLKQDFYLIGGGEQAPGVGPFTSATADAAVASFFNLIKPFRKLPNDLRQDNIWTDFVHMSIHSNEPKSNPECVYCGTRMLLLRSEKKYRLEMPKLGEI